MDKNFIRIRRKCRKIWIELLWNNLFKEESITKLKNIILHWINIFSLGEDVIELRGMYYINIGKHSYNKYKKKYLIESLKKLVVLCEKAEKENKIIEHWGI